MSSFSFLVYWYFIAIVVATVTAEKRVVNNSYDPVRKPAAEKTNRYLRSIFDTKRNNDDDRRSSHKHHQLDERDLQDGDTCQSMIDTICGMENAQVFCDIVTNNHDLSLSLNLTDATNATLFLPTDDAFDSTMDTLQLLNEKETYRVLYFHFYDGLYKSFEELVCSEKITNQFDDSSRTRCDNKNEEKYQKGNGNTKTGSLPKIVEKDIVACNGIIHTIDHLMLPVHLSQFGDSVLDDILPPLPPGDLINDPIPPELIDGDKCTTNDDCINNEDDDLETHYCAMNGLCTPVGSCSVDVDCMNKHNQPHSVIMCVGRTYCSDDKRCTKECDAATVEEDGDDLNDLNNNNNDNDDEQPSKEIPYSLFVEECVITDDQPCDYEYLKSNLPRGKKQWFVVPPENDESTGCLDGSRYGFGVYLPPSVGDEKREDGEEEDEKTKLMIWFQGGGACYDYDTCFGESKSASVSATPEKEGYFNYGLGERNPMVKGNYAAVSISYCSGDMHIGNSVVELISVVDPSVSQIAKFSGYNNTMSVLNWIKDQPGLSLKTSDGGGNIDEISASGCSAGSLGIQMWSNYLVNEFGVSKIQPDSYIGLLPPKANIILNTWNACDTAGSIGMSEDLVRRCKCDDYDDIPIQDCLHTMPPVFEDFLTKHPTIPIAYTGSTHDVIQRGYYTLLTTIEDELYSSLAPDSNETSMGAAFLYASKHFPTFLMNSIDSFGIIGDDVSNYIVDTIEHCFVNRDSTYRGVGGIFGDRTVSNHAKCLETKSNGEGCKKYVDMAQFVNDFLNDDVYDGTPNYPDPYPPSWHISCEEAANNVQRVACDKCGYYNNNTTNPDLLPFKGSSVNINKNSNNSSSSSPEELPPFCLPLPGDDSGFPTEEQLAWLESDDAREWFEDYKASLVEVET